MYTHRRLYTIPALEKVRCSLAGLFSNHDVVGGSVWRHSRWQAGLSEKLFYYPLSNTTLPHHSAYFEIN